MGLKIGFACLEPGKVAARQTRELQRSLKHAAKAAVDSTVSNPDGVIHSFSHSRGVAMAAALSPGENSIHGLVGCDVEYLDARRSWREIGVFLAGETFSGDAVLACQAWTLAEAWFKAFGRWPVRSLVERALVAGAPDNEAIALASSIYWFQNSPCPGFAASLVWRGDRVTPQVLCA